MRRCYSLPMVTTLMAGAFIALPVSQSVSNAQQDVLARSRAVYAGLMSYADTGTVVFEFGPAQNPIVERHTFKTYYRAPRHYFFDFVEDRKAGGDRHVVWSDAEAFHTWNSVTRVESTFPKGQGAAAFVIPSVGTLGSVLKIAPLLFPQADLQGTVTEFETSTEAGLEVVDGRRCHTLVGIAKSVYAQTGREVNVRGITIWIDAETMLIRKVFEDTPKGGVAGNLLRYTTTFEPQANPTLDELKFRFVVPSGLR